VSIVDESLFGNSLPPWISFFENSPLEALDELFSNTYYQGSLNTVEPEHLLLDWAFAIDSIEFREMLDSALAKWIAQRWNSNYQSIEPIDLTWHRALRVTALLEPAPEKAIAELQLRQDTAVSYLGPLVRSRACDPLGWYWATVSRDQPDERLVLQWFRLCNLVPGTPVFHGTWGLLGLQRAPGEDRAGFRVGVAAGLERYLRALARKVDEGSLGQREADQFARSAIRNLSNRYPFPYRWREYWSNVETAIPSRVRTWVMANWGDKAFQRVQRARGQLQGLSITRPSSEWVTRSNALAARLGNPADMVARDQAVQLLDEQRSYAYKTGDTYYIVRTLRRFSFIINEIDPRVSRNWAGEALEWDPWSSYSWNAVVAANSAAGNTDEAVRLSYEAIDRFPGDAIVRNWLGKVLRRAGRLEEAEAVYREMFERFPDDAFAGTGLGELLLVWGRLEEAEAVYRETLERFPSNTVVRNGLAMVLRRSGRLEDADAIYRETIERFPADMFARSGLAAVLLRAGRLDDAEAVYRETLQRFPGDRVTRNGLAVVLRKAGRLDEAEAVYRETLEQSSGDTFARNGLAVVLLRAGRLEEAEAVYRETLGQSSGDTVTRNGLAVVLLKAGRLEEAEAVYRETLERFPGDVVTRNGLAVVLLRAGRLEEAEAVNRETLQRFPGDEVTRNGLAVVLLRAGRLEEAEAVYRETVERFPGDTFARNGLAVVLLRAGRLEDAEAVYRETVERFPGDTFARNGLAAVLLRAGRLDEAEAVTPEMAEPIPDQAVTDTTLDALLHQAEQPEEAEAVTPEAAEPVPGQAVTDTALQQAEQSEDVGIVPADIVRDLPGAAASRYVDNSKSLRQTLRAGMRRAFMFKGEERNVLLRELIQAADGFLNVNSHDVDALYAKAEALQALGSHVELEALLRSLPDYVSERPEFQAMWGRLQLAVLVANKPQPFDRAVVSSVVTPWDSAARSAPQLRGVAATARLRAANAMMDGTELNEFRQEATANVSRLISRQSQSSAPVHQENELAIWWANAVGNAIGADKTSAALAYDEIAPKLERNISLLDTLDDELVSACRYIYAPR
jgi:Flp pilus assembly protein TadD